MISRKQLTEIVTEFVNDKIRLDSEPDEQIETATTEESTNRGGERPSEFVPSRGDESYLFKTHDPKLKDILSHMLDVSEEYDTYIWEELERART